MICTLCSKETKKEVDCRLLNEKICMICCFSISSGDLMMNKIRKEKGFVKDDILDKCLSCIQNKDKKQ
ncbi:MAG: hypothetical protein PHE88_11145 [Elusimicrobia bacterium]|nr:hypothetical protein [Elusimicrobiota bacterium]